MTRKMNDPDNAALTNSTIRFRFRNEKLMRDEPEDQKISTAIAMRKDSIETGTPCN